MTSYLHSQLSKFRDDGKYCNVIILVDGEEFRCHRLILATVSEFFDLKLNGTFEGSRNEEIIPLDDVKAGPFKAVLDYAYKGHEPSLDVRNVFDILRTCDFLGASKLIEICVSYIKDNIPWLSDFVEIWLESSKYKIPSLNFTTKYFEMFSSLQADSVRLFEMTFDEIRLLLNLYRKPPAIFLQTKDMDSLLNAIILWICHLYKERASHFEELSRFVDFKYVSAEYLSEVEKYGIKCDDRTLLEQCLTDYFSHNDALSASPTSVLPTNQSSTIHAFVEYSRAGKKSTAIFSLRESEPCLIWSRSSTTLECPFENARSVELWDRRLYFFGCGGDFKGHSSSFLVYQTLKQFPYNHSASELICPPCKSDKFDMCKTSDSEALFWYNADPHNHIHYSDLPPAWSQPFTDEQIYRGIYRYVFGLDCWYPVPKMKKTVANSCMAADDRRVYLIGGGGREKGRRRNFGGQVQAFDYRTPDWQELPMTVNAYCDAASCTLDGKIYVSDGELLEMYDTVAGKWMVISCRYDDSKDARLMENRNEFFNQKRMVSFNNLLWQFSSERSIDGRRCSFSTNIVDPYAEVPSKWRTSSSLQNVVRYDDTLNKLFCRNYNYSRDYDYYWYETDDDSVDMIIDEAEIIDICVFKRFTPRYM